MEFEREESHMIRLALCWLKCQTFTYTRETTFLAAMYRQVCWWYGSEFVSSWLSVFEHLSFWSLRCLSFRPLLCKLRKTKYTRNQVLLNEHQGAWRRAQAINLTLECSQTFFGDLNHRWTFANLYKQHSWNLLFLLIQLVKNLHNSTYSVNVKREQ